MCYGIKAEEKHDEFMPLIYPHPHSCPHYPYLSMAYELSRAMVSHCGLQSIGGR